MSLLGELMGPVAALMYVCMWCKDLFCAKGRVVTLVQTVGGRLEAKTCGRFASYPATNLDVSETRLAFFFYSIDTWNCLVVNRPVLFTVKRCVFRRFVLRKSSLFTIKVVV